MAEKQTITVTVEGGVIQWIGGIPKDLRVVVKDYDTDGADSEDVEVDENGDEYAEAVWEHEDDEQGKS